MRKYLILVLIVFSINNLQAQVGARVGLINGIAISTMQNTDDAKAGEKILKTVSTPKHQFGIDAAYHWRWVGIGAQLLYARAGQNYNFYNQFATTRLNYLKPVLLFHFNSNPKKKIRMSGFVGGYYASLLNFTEYSQNANNADNSITNTYITKNNIATLRNADTTLNAPLRGSIYYPSDAGVVFGIGADFRYARKWIIGLHARVDYGLEKLENYNSIQQVYVENGKEKTFSYEHWKYRPSKFDLQYSHPNVRASSTNLSYGLYLNVKYMLLSDNVYDYERYGY
jgi:hypothetical protein